MIIAVNGKSLSIAEKGGAVRVAVNLIRHIGTIRDDIELRVFVPPAGDVRDQYHGYEGNVKFYFSRSQLYRNRLGRALWEQFRLPLLIRRQKDIDLLLNLTNTAPVVVKPGVPQILLVHDLGFLNTSWFSASFSSYLKLILNRAAAKKIRVISVSKSTANEIAETFPRIKEVKAILNASDDPVENFPDLRFKGPYLLFLGNLNPRKNIKGTILGFQILRSRTDPDMALVIIGAEQPFFAEWGRDSVPLENVHFKGYIDGAEKWAWLKQAELVVLPSFLESFGLPVLEAMKVGTPAVVSNIPAFRELYGDAVEYVDPHAPQDIARGIVSVLENPDKRRRMVKRGKETAIGYSWKASAAEYVSIFEKTIQESSG
jgi:glycosyltransferase involved in cell wall biosynthesis